MNDGSLTLPELRPRSRYAKALSFLFSDTLFSHSRYPWVLIDLFLAFIFFEMSVSLSPFRVWGHFNQTYIVCGVVYSLAHLVFGLGLGLYDRAARFDYGAIFRFGVLANVLAGVSTLLFFYFVYYNVMGRWTLVFGTVGTTVGILVVRSCLAWVLRRNPYRFTVAGSSKSCQEVVAHLGRQGRLSDFYVYAPWTQIFPNDRPTLDGILLAKVSDLVMTQEALQSAEAIDFAVLCLQAKVRVVDEATFYMQVLERLPIDEISRDWVLRQGIARRQIFTLTLKRLMDIFGAGLGLLLLSPFLFVIAAGIKLTCPGPIFFVQPRQGRYSHPFKMYKFRTMKLAMSDATASQGFTKKGDSRVNAIGRILRPLHLDELPQLLNIFLGDMSLVGPRPEALDFAKRMRVEVPLYELRYLVRPGLTGHAQINQGYAMDNVKDTKRKLSYDLFYLCHHSTWLDLQIMLKTFFFLSKKAR